MGRKDVRPGNKVLHIPKAEIYHTGPGDMRDNGREENMHTRCPTPDRDHPTCPENVHSGFTNPRYPPVLTQALPPAPVPCSAPQTLRCLPPENCQEQDVIAPQGLLSIPNTTRHFLLVVWSTSFRNRRALGFGHKLISNSLFLMAFNIMVFNLIGC